MTAAPGGSDDIQHLSNAINIVSKAGEIQHPLKWKPYIEFGIKQTQHEVWFLMSGQRCMWKTSSDKWVSKCFAFKTYSSYMDFPNLPWLQPFFFLYCVVLTLTTLCVQVQVKSHTTLLIASPSLWNQEQSKSSPGHNGTTSCKFSHYCAYIPGERDAAWKVNVSNVVAVSHYTDLNLCRALAVWFHVHSLSRQWSSVLMLVYLPITDLMPASCSRIRSIHLSALWMYVTILHSW